MMIISLIPPGIILNIYPRNVSLNLFQDLFALVEHEYQDDYLLPKRDAEINPTAIESA